MQIGTLAARCSDKPTEQAMRETQRMLIEAAREQAAQLVDDSSALEALILTTCSRPGHTLVLRDLLGQIWAGYAGAAGAYVARAPSRHHVLEAIAVRASELRLPTTELDSTQFPMLSLHTPHRRTGPAVPAGATR